MEGVHKKVYNLERKKEKQELMDFPDLLSSKGYLP